MFVQEACYKAERQRRLAAPNMSKWIKASAIVFDTKRSLANFDTCLPGSAVLERVQSKLSNNRAQLKAQFFSDSEPHFCRVEYVHALLDGIRSAREYRVIGARGCRR
jgi:hypothetical protein